MKHGAAIDARADLAFTPLLYSAQQNHPHIVTALIEAGADVAAKEAEFGWSALHIAAQWNLTDVAQALIQRKVDIEAGDKGWKVRDGACLPGHK